MPEQTTKRKAARARRQGKAPTTQAGAFVEEEMHHVKEGKHGAKSRAQAIAIGLSKARRSGVKVKKKAGTSKARNRKKVSGQRSTKPPQRNRRTTAKSGARRAPASRSASAKTSRSRTTKSSTRKTGTARKTTGRSRTTAGRKSTSRGRSRKS